MFLAYLLVGLIVLLWLWRVVLSDDDLRNDDRAYLMALALAVVWPATILTTILTAMFMPNQKEKK